MLTKIKDKEYATAYIKALIKKTKFNYRS